jgi:hypothetical protein
VHRHVPGAWFNRLVLSRWASSQLRLNRLYAPPPMMVGELYAQVVKLLALCMFCHRRSDPTIPT